MANMKIEQVTYTFHGMYDGQSEIHIGESDPTKRVCRFCGRSVRENATFNHISHAISQGIGNHNILCNEECDECNNAFHKIEQDFINFHIPILCTYGIQGKPKPRKYCRSAIPVLDSPEYKITNNGNGIMIQLKGKSANAKLDSIENDHKLDITNSLKWHKYIPINLYKTLCKFIISIVNNDDLPIFNNTISWIKGENSSPTPSMVIYNQTKDVHIQPKIAYLVKSEGSSLIPPFCIGIIIFGNLCYFFEVPFTTNWECDNSDMKKRAFIEFAEKIFPQEYFVDKFKFIDFSSNISTTSNMQLSFSQSATLVKGRDWILADTKEDVEKLRKLYNL